MEDAGTVDSVLDLDSGRGGDSAGGDLASGILATHFFGIASRGAVRDTAMVTALGTTVIKEDILTATLPTTVTATPIPRLRTLRHRTIPIWIRVMNRTQAQA